MTVSWVHCPICRVFPSRTLASISSLPVVEAKRVRSAERKAEGKAKVAKDKLKDVEKMASEAEAAWQNVEEAQRRAEDALATAQLKHSRYLQEALLAILDQAR